MSPRLHAISVWLALVFLSARQSRSFILSAAGGKAGCAGGPGGFGAAPRCSALQCASQEYEDGYYEECHLFADATACAMETVIDVTSEEQFDFIIDHAAGADPIDKDRKPHEVVVVMMHANWCRKCKYMIKKYLEVAAQNPQLLCLKINLVSQPELGRRLGVRGIPMYIVFKKGDRVDHFYAENEDTLRQSIFDCL